MQRYKHGAALCVGQSRAVIKGRIFVSGARLEHLKSLGLESAAYLKGQIQHQLALANPLCSTRSWIRSAVSGIEHNNIQPGSLRLRRRKCRRGRSREGRVRRLRGGLRLLLRFRVGRKGRRPNQQCYCRRKKSDSMEKMAVRDTHDRQDTKTPANRRLPYGRSFLKRDGPVPQPSWFTAKEARGAAHGVPSFLP